MTAKRKAKADPMAAELAGALGALVKARLAKPKRLPTWQQPDRKVKPSVSIPIKRRRRSRVGFKTYSATTKLDYSRPGTFRHYMIATIRKHDNTLSASRDHDDNCPDTSWAKNKLDFSWAEKNGYITWE